MVDKNGVFVPPDITTEVKTDKPISRAYLGNNQTSITFPFNPDTISWNYQENITSMDTLGGRVTQLLSIQLTGIELTMRAGSRESFQNIITKLKEIMGYHTNSLNPVHFKVPSRNWDFIVYLVSIPDAGWDVTATSYPFKLSLEVEDDITGIKTKQISSQVIANIQKDIGYDKGHHGGNAQEFYSIIETISKNRLGGSTDTEIGDIISTGNCTDAQCTVADFCAACLESIGAPVTQDILNFMIAWAAKEGGSVNNSADWNLWNTGRGGAVPDKTLCTTGGGVISGGQVRFPAYCTAADGIRAFKNTMENGLYDKVIAAIKTGSSANAITALFESPWCLCELAPSKCKCGQHCCAYRDELPVLMTLADTYGKNKLP